VPQCPIAGDATAKYMVVLLAKQMCISVEAVVSDCYMSLNRFKVAVI